jgi:lysophospholipase L1-like esterase
VAPGRILIALLAFALFWAAAPVLAAQTNPAISSKKRKARRSAPKPSSAIPPPASTVLPPPPPELILKNGDRIVWLGDSITAAQLYGRDVETFLMLRRPDLSLSFINSGVGGNSAWDGLRRLESDVIAEHPTVVVINFGMNDSAATNGHHADFINNMEAIFACLRAANIRRIVWVEPTPMDTYGRAGVVAIRHAARLNKLVAAIETHRSEPDITLVHWYAPMKLALQRYRADGEQLIPDRIHPNTYGHAVMAAELLRGIGADISPAAINSTFSGGILSTTFKRFDEQSALPSSVTTTDTPMPAGSPANIDLARIVPPVPFISHAEALRVGNEAVLSVRALHWRVQGLAPQARFRVQLNDYSAGEFSGAQLAEGVDLLDGLERSLPTQASGDACTLANPVPFETETGCALSLVLKKDQLQILMRSGRTRPLPDIIPDRLSAYLSFMSSWMADVAVADHDEIRELRQKPHILHISQIE